MKEKKCSTSFLSVPKLFRMVEVIHFNTPFWGGGEGGGGVFFFFNILFGKVLMKKK